MKLLSSLTLVGLAMLPGSLVAQPQTGHGFNYWPHGFSNDILHDAKWLAPANQARLRADIDFMASINTKAVRLMFWPGREISGFYIDNGYGEFDDVYYQLLGNLPSLVDMFAQRGIRVIIAFGNSFQVSGACPPELDCICIEYGSCWQPWWVHEYGPGAAAHARFTLDSLKWTNGIISSLLSSGADANVEYYDLHQEFAGSSPARLFETEYTRGVYDGSAAPVAKRGFSVLDVAVDLPPFISTLQSRPVAFADFHCYPAHEQPVNPNLEQSYQALISALGRPTFIGEYGRKDNGACLPAAPDCSERRQRDHVVDIWNRANGVGAQYALNWLLWGNDGSGGVTDHETVWGTEHNPRHVVGKMSELLGAMPNPDAESINAAQNIPHGWVAGSSGLVPTFVAMNDLVLGRPSASTNDWYARLTTSATPVAQEVWISTPMFAVTGGQTLYANAYVRSNLSNVRLVVVEYSVEQGNVVATEGPAIVPSPSAFRSYLHDVDAGGWRLQLQAETSYVLVAVAATVPALLPGLCTLDVDTMSATAR